jgi:hypothetical protein
MRAILIVPVLAALVACANPSSPAAQPSPEQPTELRITLAPPDMSGPMYIEGAVRFVHVTGNGIDVDRRLEGDQTVLALPAGGDVTLATWARPCDGNCDTLDGATDRCDAPLSVPVGTSVAVEIAGSPGHDCTITVTG